jgi:hypothetical protein
VLVAATPIIAPVSKAVAQRGKFIDTALEEEGEAT